MKVALAFLAAVAGLASAGVGAAKPRVLKVTSPVAAGTTASASISVQRGARCSIEVRIAGAVLGGRGLGSKRAQTRRIVWTWRVPPGAAPGRWPITVDCGAAGAARTSFVVVCPSGFVASRASCRPAPDLRVAVAGTPAANRVGGRFSFRIEVLNVGKAAAPDVVLTAEASAELVAVGAEGGSCVPSGPVPGVRCDVGRLAAGARTTATLELRATTLGALSVSARAASSTPDARPADNAAAASTGVTPPDSVSGSGVRPSFGSALVIAYVELDAISGSGGDDAAGRFTTRYASSGFVRLELQGHVTCLAVAGNRATVGGVVESSSNPVNSPIGRGIVFTLTDYGDAAADTTATYLDQPVPVACTGFEYGTGLALLEGNLVVHDES